MQPRVAELLNRVRQPFNVNSLALAAARAALEDRKFVAKSTRMNRSGMAPRAQLQEARPGDHSLLREFHHFPGLAANAVYEKLLRQGVIVRPLAVTPCPSTCASR